MMRCVGPLTGLARGVWRFLICCVYSRVNSCVHVLCTTLLQYVHCRVTLCRWQQIGNCTGAGQCFHSILLSPYQNTQFVHTVRHMVHVLVLPYVVVLVLSGREHACSIRSCMPRIADAAAVAHETLFSIKLYQSVGPHQS
jgi:hypothetical protein